MNLLLSLISIIFIIVKVLSLPEDFYLFKSSVSICNSDNTPHEIYIHREINNEIQKFNPSILCSSKVIDNDIQSVFSFKKSNNFDKLIIKPDLEVSHKEWTVLVELHKETNVDMSVEVTDRIGKVHQHIIPSKFIKYGPIAVGMYDLADARTGNTLQGVSVRPVSSISLNDVTSVFSMKSQVLGVHFEVQTIPSSIDHSKNTGKTTEGVSCSVPVQDQGSCGSCYAFSAMTAATWRTCIANNNYKLLSVRQIACGYA